MPQILASARCFKIGNTVLHNLELCCGEIVLCLNLSVVKIQKEASVVSIWLFVRESVLSLKRSGLWEEGRREVVWGGGQIPVVLHFYRSSAFLMMHVSAYTNKNILFCCCCGGAPEVSCSRVYIN